MKPVLRVEKLSKSFGGLKAAHDFGLELGAKDIQGIIGPNGAGKTTTLRTIATLLQIESGSVNVLGYELPGDAAQVRQIISYLRVSTGKQGKSGLGIEAQREAIARFAAAEGCEVIAEFVEVETGKGSDALERRPQLAAALAKRFALLDATMRTVAVEQFCS